MKKKSPKSKRKTTLTTSRLSKIGYVNIVAFAFSFVIVLCGICIIALKGLAVKKIRSSFPTIISSLNEMGIDLAYDNIKFSPLFFTPLMRVEQPQIYALDENNYWNLQFDNLTADFSFFEQNKIVLRFSNHGNISFDEQSYSTTNNTAAITLDFKQQQLQDLSLQAKQFNIHQFADIQNLMFKLHRTPWQNSPDDAALNSWISSLDITDVTINGMVNYPLSSNLTQLSLQANVIGDFIFKDDFLTSAEDWVKNRGFIDIPNLVLQWSPLTIVGRGQCKFTPLLAPEISFNTSSKGLLKLLDSLLALKLVDAKNVYVAKILLNNKAYKLNADDKELTISTPISYADGKISIDNLPIKDFDKDIRQ